MPLIHRVELQAADPASLAEFYGAALGLPVEFGDTGEIGVTVGISTLAFSAATDSLSRPSYHFAFAVPPGAIESARAWLAKRTPLLKSPAGEDRFRFERWNADAVYFKDPAGNIGELIARSAPASPGAPFGAASIRSICEIGLVVPDVPGAADTAERGLGWRRYGVSYSDFTAVGDDSGLLIFVTAGRRWFPEDSTPAYSAPTVLTVAATPRPPLQFPAARCTIHALG